MKSKVEIFGQDFDLLPESWYSSLRDNQKYSLNRILRQIFPVNPKIVVDCTAHVGCDALNFSQLFQCQVIAIEINPKAVKCLFNNIAKFSNRKLFTIIEADVIDWLHDMATKADLYYFDPPWGGRDYINQDKLPLTLGPYAIGQIVNYIFDQNLTNNIMIKIPNNFDYDDFESDVTLAYDIYDVMTTNGKIAFKLIHVVNHADI